MKAIILDTETHKLHGEVIQLAYFGIDENSLLSQEDKDSFSMYFRPSEAIDYSAMAIHHIIDQDLEMYPPSSKVFIPSDVEYVIGHNIDYDIDAIQRSMGIGSEVLANLKKVDTLSIIRYLHPEWSSHKLVVCCYRLATEGKVTSKVSWVQSIARQSHNAMMDCYLTEILLEYIVNSLNLQSIEELYQASEHARIPTHIFYGPHKGKAIKDLFNEDISWLQYKSKDPYLLRALNIEMEERSSAPGWHQIHNELPFI
ncbi:3'-5' exonuclease [Acinetobacter bereziniae]|uniref:3'-5' exonuclease n=1 Tax=Acinetobacter bereziniae TaxID=106648 RepID=UPI0029553503|nr:3'-5' exonuclease [Acinetobacter bereziniae]MDV8157459.1 3'-5' exonuclease [Acinetobacter bereziniae]